MAASVMTSEEPWTVRRILDWTIAFLKERGSETPRLDAEVLLAHARQCRRIQLYTQYDELLTDAQRAAMRQLVKRRAASEPVAYLVGRREFFSLEFLVSPGVFIPRPDTEILVMAALEKLKEFSAPRLLDLCTGTGCVPIAIVKNHADVQAVTVERDPHVATVAASNIAKHDVASRVTLISGDLFEPLPAGARFHVVTSNPPYIPSHEIEELDADVRVHEPRGALDGGEDGLDVVRRLVDGAPDVLTPGGWLMFEISPEQASACCELLKGRGFTSVGVRNDLSGQARVVLGQWSRSAGSSAPASE